MKTIGSFGGGVDSTTLIAIDLNRDTAASWLNLTRGELDDRFPSPDQWVFSDTGAEFAQTYTHIEHIRQLLGDRFAKVRREGENITQWCTRLGIVPLMPGASHICSLKFKGEVLQKYTAAQYPGQPIQWLIGIEADEGKRIKRFQKPRGDENVYRYPLMELGMTRDDCIRMLESFGWDVPHKSSCVFCPFMSEGEIRDLYLNNPKGWNTALEIEHAFAAISATKHQAWIDAGKPLTNGKRPRAPKGMWRLDSWKEGARLFAKRIDGRQLSLEKWAARIDAESVALIVGGKRSSLDQFI